MSGSLLGKKKGLSGKSSVTARIPSEVIQNAKNDFIMGKTLAWCSERHDVSVSKLQKLCAIEGWKNERNSGESGSFGDQIELTYTLEELMGFEAEDRYNFLFKDLERAMINTIQDGTINRVKTENFDKLIALVKKMRSLSFEMTGLEAKD